MNHGVACCAQPAACAPARASPCTAALHGTAARASGRMGRPPARRASAARASGDGARRIRHSGGVLGIPVKRRGGDCDRERSRQCGMRACEVCEGCEGGQQRRSFLCSLRTYAGAAGGRGDRRAAAARAPAGARLNQNNHGHEDNEGASAGTYTYVSVYARPLLGSKLTRFSSCVQPWRRVLYCPQ